MTVKAYALGLKTTKGFDNFPVWNTVVQTLKDKTSIQFADGHYWFSDSPIINRTIHLRGSDETIFDIATGKQGLQIKNGYKIKLSDLTIWHYANQDASQNIGLYISAVVICDNVTVRGFAGNGFHISADIAGSKTNASHSRFTGCNAIENGGDGFYMRGGDANQMIFFACDARDNFGWGFNDESFLGCQGFGNMAHANKKGHYRAYDPNNRSTFLACYRESDSPPDELTGYATSIGGINEKGCKLSQNAMSNSGKYFSAINFANKIELNDRGITFFQTNEGSFPVRLQGIDSPFPHLSYNHDLGGRFHEVWAASSGAGATDYEQRKVPFSSTGLKSVFIGSRLLAEGKPTDDWQGFVFKSGDTLLNPDYDGTNTERWIFKVNDWQEIQT